MNPPNRRPFFFFVIVIAALLVIAAAHTLRLNGLNMNGDEVWHIWQSFGTPDQIVSWTPYDWTPLYPIVLGGWRLIAGIHPFALKILSMLASLIGAAFAYKTGAKIAGRWAGVLTMLSWSAFAYSIFLSGYVRPYAIAHPLIPMGLYFTLRYFEAAQANMRTVIGWGTALTVTLIVSFYTILTTPLWAALFGLYTLIVYPLRRVILRWLPVAALFVIASLPIVIAFQRQFGRSLILEAIPFAEGMTTILGDYFGKSLWIWAALLVIAVIAWLVRRSHTRPVIAFALWSFGGLLAMFALHPRLGFFLPSYSFWTLTGFALLGGVLLAALPRIGRIGAALVITAVMFVPLPPSLEQNYAPPGVANFTWLRDHVRAGDELILDPGFDCLADFELDYYARAFFPEGLVIRREPSQARRVWVATNQNTVGAEFHDEVTFGRIPSIFVGTPVCLFRLYEAPPDPVGIAFENGMRFHGAEVIEQISDQTVPLTRPLAAREGETIRLRLWWSADQTPERDYSVGLYVIGADGIPVAQSDSAPQTDPPETSRWLSDALYVEERTITLPNPLPRGSYPITMAVYGWWDQARIPAQGETLTIPLMNLSIMSW